MKRRSLQNRFRSGGFSLVLPSASGRHVPVRMELSSRSTPNRRGLFIDAPFCSEVSGGETGLPTDAPEKGFLIWTVDGESQSNSEVKERSASEDLH